MGRELIATVEGSDATATIAEEAAGITSVKLACDLLKNTQSVDVGDTVLMRLETDGQRKFFRDSVKLELSPEGIFEFTTLSWNAKAKDSTNRPWILLTQVTAKKEGDAELKVYIEGNHTNTIKLTTKITHDKDVFDSKAIKRLIDEINYISPFANSESPNEYAGNYCMAAAERGLSELLSDITNFYSVNRSTHTRKNKISFFKKSAIDRGKKFNELGFVKNLYSFNKYTVEQSKRSEINKSKNRNDATIKYNEVKYDIVKLNQDNKIIVLNKFKADIKDKLGFHVYYMSITGGFHTLLLVIDNRNPCFPEYKIYDQHGLTSSNGDLNGIGEGLRRQTSWTFANSCLNRYLSGRTEFFDSLETNLWKIQKK